MKILALYQDIEGGTKNATEALLKECQHITTAHHFTIYRQPDLKLSGPFQYTRHFLWAIWDFRRVLNQYPQGTFDCIYFTIFTAAVAKYLSKHNRIPGFFHFHGNQEFAQNLESEATRSYLGKLYNFLLGKLVEFLQKFSLVYSEKVCFVSEIAKDQFIEKQKLTSILDKVIVNPNGVDTHQFFPLSKHQKQVQKRKLFPDNADLDIILYSGRIDEKKGILQLVQAFIDLERPDTLLVIMHPQLREKHSFYYLAQLQQLITDKQVTQTVQFVENPTNIREYYQVADLVVLPSDIEYFSLVIFEAFASGVPFMGTKVGEIPSVLKEIDHNLILRDNSPNTIQQQLKWYFALSSQQQQLLIKKGLALAQRNKWANNSKRVIEEISQLVREQ